MGKKYWSKGIILVLCALCITIITGCGGPKQVHQLEEDYMVFWSEEEEFISPATTGEAMTLFGGQVFGEEYVQLWAQRIKDETESTLDIYLYHQDGTKELLLDGVSDTYFSRSGWYMAADGGYYVFVDNGIAKLDATGKEVFRSPVAGSVYDICQLKNGSVWLLIYNTEGIMRLAEVDDATGEIELCDNVALGEDLRQYIAAGEQNLLVLDLEGIWEVDARKGSRENLISFKEYDYDLEGTLLDFLVLENGDLELMRTNVIHKLRLENINEDRIILVYRGYYPVFGLQDYIAQFNQNNETYYIVEEYGSEEEIDVGDWHNRTLMELGVGKGPDIITLDAVGISSSILEKGVLVDLTSYIEDSGMKREDYFSNTFDVWRREDKIYGIDYKVSTKGLVIDQNILTNWEFSEEIEDLVDALAESQTPAEFKMGWDAAGILSYFLQGSENLWGMIDWEAGTCDFSGELFAKMMEVAKRYHYTGEEKYPYIADTRYSYGYYDYETDKELESNGEAYVGYFFDDGCHTAITAGNYTLGINIHSPNADGVWEFFEFLLSEEVQSSRDFHYFSYFPVNKNAFDEIAEWELAEGAIRINQHADGRSSRTFKRGCRVAGGEDPEYFDKVLYKDPELYRSLFDLKPETIAEIRTFLEDIRMLPTDTSDILGIIKEEAGAYFSNNKSIEEVIPIIENRVQLYLDENN